MAEITGQIKGAYREEGFILDNDGNPVTLVDILNMILSGDALIVEAENGLRIQDGKVYLGGTLIEDTYIDSTTKFLQIGYTTSVNKSFLVQDPAGKNFTVSNADATNKQFFSCKTDEVVIQVTDAGTNEGGQFGASPDQASISHGPINGDPVNTSVSCYVDQVVIEGVQEYANDAAADADTNLLSGGLYTVTGSRALLIKP